MSARKFAVVCLSLCLQLVVPPQVFAQAASSGTATHTPINMDLSSTNKNVSAPIAGTITENSSSKTISIGDLITPAERVALYQVQHTGQQSIQLGANAAAIGGSLTISSKLAGLGISNLVVPQGVTAIDSAATFNLSGNLTNSGNIYAVSTNTATTTAAISAANIYNQQGALLSTILPTSGLSGFANAISGLHLSLTAINNIVNSGTISSAGNLSVMAGGTITNALPAGVTGTQPIMQAMNNLNLVSNIGNIVNAGLISSINGNINIAAANNANLSINNLGGTLSALNGLINVRDSSFTGAFNTNISGGDILAQAVNVYSGTGNIDLNVNNISGLLNMYGCSGSVQTNNSNLQLGTVNFTGDPTIYNTGGNITLTSDLSFPGQDLAIVAGGDIISNGAQIINTSSTNAGGQITLIAGAAFTTSSGATAAQPGSPDNTSLITITGGTVGGGKIDLASTPIIAMSSVGKFNAGGNVTMVAYGGTRAGSGQVLLPSSLTITTGSGGTDVNGNVSIFAGGASGNTINVGNINTQGAANGTGNIFLLASNPSMTGCKNCTGNVEIVNGKIISGAFSTDSNQYPTTHGNILAGNLLSSGGAIQALAGGTLTTGTVNTSGSSATGVNGGIALLAGAATGNAITAGDITTAGAVVNSGDILVLTSTPDTIVCTSCRLTSRQANTGGSVSLGNVLSAGNVDIRAGGDLSASSLTSGGSGNPFGGTIGIVVDNKNTSANTFVVGGTGADSVGSIAVQAGANGGGTIGVVSGGSGGINVANQAAVQVMPNGSATGNGAAIGFNAKFGALTTPGTWNANGNTQGNGGFLNFAGQTINFTSPVQMSANGAGNGNGGSINITGGTITLPSTTSVLSANGAGNGNGGFVQVASNNGTTIGSGGLSASATGAGFGMGGQIGLTSGGALALGNGAVNLDVSANNGSGGTINISGDSVNGGSAALLANANSVNGTGGDINLTANSVATTSGAMTLNANSTNSSAGSIGFFTNSLTTGTGAFTMNANTPNGFGGSVNMQALQINTGSGAVTVNANGSQGGGFISATVDSTSGQSGVFFNANAAGNQAGSGGAVMIATEDPSASLNVGNQAGQIRINATGYSTDGSQQNGGFVSVTTGGNLSVDGSAVNAGTSAANGAGAAIALTAGAGGQGILNVTGNLNADGVGTGNGGSITLSYADNNILNSVNTSGAAAHNVANISARALGSGAGGSILVSNTNGGSLVGVQNDGSMSVSSASGPAGSITIAAAGTTDAPQQDITVTGAGTFNGPVTAIGRAVTFNLTNQATYNVGTMQSVGGDMLVTIPNISVSGSAIMTSTGAMTITTGSLANNGTITASGAMTLTNQNSLFVSGTGTLQGNTIKLNSTNGIVASTQNTYNGTVSGTGATGFSLVANQGDLSVGNVSASGGGTTLVANGGNLNLTTGSQIIAGNGDVLIQDNFAGGVIKFNPNVAVSASSNGGKDTGEVMVALGAVPAKPIAGSTPANMTVDLSHGGKAYWGANGISSQCCNQVASVDGNTRIVFSTGSAPSTGIILTSGDTINATNRPTVAVAPPPSGNGGTPGHGGTPPGQGGTPPGQGGTSPGLVSGPGVGAALGLVLNAATNAAATVPNGTTGLINALSNAGGAINKLTALLAEGNVGGNDNGTDIAEESDNDHAYVPVAFIQPAAPNASRLAPFQQTQTATAIIHATSESRVMSGDQDKILLKRGELVLHATKRTNVQSGDCKLVVEPGTVVHIQRIANATKVRNLYGAVSGSLHASLGTNAKSMTIAPGQELTISEGDDAREAISADKVSRRRVEQFTLANNRSAVTCEYSLLSLIGASRLLANIFHSQSAEDKALAAKMMKMSVALTTVTASHGIYKHVEP